MKNAFLVCFVSSVAASTVKIMIAAACRERLTKVFQLIIDAVLLLVLIFSFFGISLPKFSFPDVEERMDFNKLEADMYGKVIEKAEELLADRIAETVEERFGVRPYKCVAIIDEDSLVVEYLHVYFGLDDALISAYDVKEFLKDQYDIKAEVIFK